MIDERAFLHEVESASPEQFAEMLRGAHTEQQRALRAYFGEAKFERLRVLALRQIDRGSPVKKGRVAVLPGILGSELQVGKQEVWFGFWSLLEGHFAELQMDLSGKSIDPVTAPAALRRYYGEIEQYLLRDWDVLVFPFDWRFDMRTSADNLAKKIEDRFGSGKDVHIVAHSMGGLVARSLAQRKPAMWNSMRQLIMLGTPNFGSLAITQLYTGLYRLIRIVALLDLHHKLPELLQFAKMFVGTYQMLPNPAKLVNTPDAERLLCAETYGALLPPAQRFDDARRFQAELKIVHDPKRLTYIAGTNHPTPDGVADWSRLDKWKGYKMTTLGDGTVPHSLGLLPGVRTYYVEEEHSLLPSNMTVLETVNNLLSGNPVEGVATQQPATKRASEEALRREREIEDETAETEANVLKRRVLAMRGAYQSSVIAPEEGQMMDLTFVNQLDAIADNPLGASTGGRGFSYEALQGTPIAGQFDGSSKEPLMRSIPSLRVQVCCGCIEDIGGAKPRVAGRNKRNVSVDAISVGHYIGVLPINAELALDKAITIAPSRSRSKHDPSQQNANPVADQGVITQLTLRGVIKGELGKLFFLPDHRDPTRVIVIAGMGPVGRFGPAELTVLARELFWSLPCLGKRHLATVLIGSGAGNLNVRETVRAWLCGAALSSTHAPNQRRIEQLTFVELKATKAKEIADAIRSYEQELHEIGLHIDLLPLDFIPRPKTAPSATGRQSKLPSNETKPATQILVELRDNLYRFGAVTENASFPEQDARPDPRLVAEFNDTLAVQRTLDKQKEWGEALFTLLFPEDLRHKLTGTSPIVIACDSNVAQLHWEAMVAPGLAGSHGDYNTVFLGLSPGITRQLRNNFSSLPGVPPRSDHVLRVLIVADPDPDRPLPGADREGRIVKELFEGLNGKKSQTTGARMQVHVDALIGPGQARIAQVLKRLLNYPPYDILHYTGHCDYIKEDPPSSGWLFGKRMKITANELSRIDCVPPFVFSNACQSGVTPSRPDLRSPQMAPSFAEAFFQRGVKNFVCTAWPVADDSASQFACEFYSSLLGCKGSRPVYIHEAMRNARLAIFRHGTGIQTWGAFQHYGSPWFKLF